LKPWAFPKFGASIPPLERHHPTSVDNLSRVCIFPRMDNLAAFFSGVRRPSATVGDRRILESDGWLTSCDAWRKIWALKGEARQNFKMNTTRIAPQQGLPAFDTCARRLCGARCFQHTPNWKWQSMREQYFSHAKHVFSFGWSKIIHACSHFHIFRSSLSLHSHILWCCIDLHVCCCCWCQQDLDFIQSSACVQRAPVFTLSVTESNWVVEGDISNWYSMPWSSLVEEHVKFQHVYFEQFHGSKNCTALNFHIFQIIFRTSWIFISFRSMFRIAFLIISYSALNMIDYCWRRHLSLRQNWVELVRSSFYSDVCVQNDGCLVWRNSWCSCVLVGLIVQCFMAGYFLFLCRIVPYGSEVCRPYLD